MKEKVYTYKKSFLGLPEDLSVLVRVTVSEDAVGVTDDYMERINIPLDYQGDFEHVRRWFKTLSQEQRADLCHEHDRLCEVGL